MNKQGIISNRSIMRFMIRRDECVVVLELSIVEDPADAMQYHKANKRRRRTRHLAQNCMAAGKQGWRTSDVGRYP